MKQLPLFALCSLVSCPSIVSAADNRQAEYERQMLAQQAQQQAAQLEALSRQVKSVQDQVEDQTYALRRAELARQAEQARQTIASLEQEIRALRQQLGPAAPRLQSWADYQLSRPPVMASLATPQSQLEDQIAFLSGQRARLADELAAQQVAPQRQQQAAAPKANTASAADADYDRAFAASLARAQKEFPWMSDPAHAFARRVNQLDAELKRLNLPLFYHSDKPHLLAQIVAAQVALEKGKQTAAASR